MQIRVLSASDVERALSARDAVDAMRAAFGELSGGTAAVPVRAHLACARGFMLVMPAVLGARPALGAKVVSVFPGNPSRGAPAVQGAVLLLDAETGRARALLDGTSLTGMRTAAAPPRAAEAETSPVSSPSGTPRRTLPSRRPRSRAPNAGTWESWRPSDRGLDSQ